MLPPWMAGLNEAVTNPACEGPPLRPFEGAGRDALFHPALSSPHYHHIPKDQKRSRFNWNKTTNGSRSIGCRFAPMWCAYQDSNLGTWFRRPALYPLSYRRMLCLPATEYIITGCKRKCKGKFCSRRDPLSTDYFNQPRFFHQGVRFVGLLVRKKAFPRNSARAGNGFCGKMDMKTRRGPTVFDRRRRRMSPFRRSVLSRECSAGGFLLKSKKSE